MNIINELLVNEYKVLYKKLTRENLVKSVLVSFKPKTIKLLSEWPSYKKEEGVLIAKSFYTANMKLVRAISDVNSIPEDAAKSDFFMNVNNAFEVVSTEDRKYVVSIIHNLIAGGKQAQSQEEFIVNNIAMDYYSHSENLLFITKYNLLNDISQKEMILEILILLSSLCRKSATVYTSIHSLNIIQNLKFLIDNCDSLIKSRVCNLIGNMCRHSEYFYDQIKENNIAESLINCCYDNDKSTRKFACFAIGNAAFLNDKLYEQFRPSIKILVDLLKDSEDNTRANSAGALGNFARCGDTLCSELIKYGAHESLLELAESEQISNPQIQTIKVALFALGNLCYHQSIKNELEKIGFRNRIENMKIRHKNEPQLLEHIERIKKKI